MEQTKIFSIIKKHIDSFDYYGLISGGAPKDEFDIESKQICAIINKNSSVFEIAEAIARVFSKSFNADEKPERFLPVAEKIKTDISRELLK